MTIKDLLNGGGLDAELILAHVLSVDKEYLFANSEEEVDEADVQLFNAYFEKVQKGLPVAYLTNRKEFYGLDFFVDSRVLVPRPETEQMVDRVLEFIDQFDDGENRFRILDVGTGSGNIAISVAKTLRDSGSDALEEVVAVDVSDGAVEVARLNAAQHGVDDVVKVFQSDLLEIVDDEEVFNVIVANLPYIGEEKHRYVASNVEDYEPEEALFGGFDGLQLYKKMFDQIAQKGVRASLLMGEFGFAQAEDMSELLSAYFGDKWSLEKDLAGIERIFVVRN